MINVDAAEKLIQRFDSISKSLDQMRSQWVRPVGLSVPQWRILASVKALDEEAGARVSEVAAHAGLDPSFITAQYKALVAKDLLRRQPFRGDGRVVLLSLTSRGEAKLAKIESKQASLTATIFSDFHFEDLDTLLMSFIILERRIEKASQTFALED